MSGNRDTRVNPAVTAVQGPLIGSNLLEAFKNQIKAQAVFKTMFGPNGERVYVNGMPSINESVLPALILGWASETFRSLNVYFDGQISALLVLPTQLTGDYNAQRRVASVFQRFIAGPLDLLEEVPGLIRFGVESTFEYQGLARFGGFDAPTIIMTLPFRFDLQLMRLGSDYDPAADLDKADLDFIEGLLLEVKNDDGTELTSQEVLENES